MPPTAIPLNFTVHGLDPEVAQALRDYASRTKKSLNASAKELLRTALGLPTPAEKARREAWRKACGCISKEDGDDWLKSLDAFEQIDEEMWK